MSYIYLLGQSQHVGGVEGRLEGRHLIEDATSSPNVHLLRVWLILNKFRTSRRKEGERTRETTIKNNDRMYTIMNAQNLFTCISHYSSISKKKIKNFSCTHHQ